MRQFNYNCCLLYVFTDSLQTQVSLEIKCQKPKIQWLGGSSGARGTHIPIQWGAKELLGVSQLSNSIQTKPRGNWDCLETDNFETEAVKEKKYDYVSIRVQSAVSATKRVRRDFFFHSRVRPTSGTSINLFTRSSFGLGSNHHKALQKPALNMSRNQKLKIFLDG